MSKSDWLITGVLVAAIINVGLSLTYAIVLVTS